MIRPTRATIDRTSRGQALVEMAVILPLLILFLVMAIDLGRVFFSWVGVQNAARIGADYAASHPLDGDWTSLTDPNTKTYVDRMLADATAIGCDLPDPMPLPTFPDGTSPGNTAVVTLTCDFAPITPVVASLVGAPLKIDAEATFPIRKGIVGMPGGGGPGGEEDDPLCRVVPDLSGMVGSDAETAWEVAGFSGIASVVGAPTDVVVDDSQVTNPASSPGQCITYKATLTVQTVPATTCASGESIVPEVAGLLVSQARARWQSNGFDVDGFDPPVGVTDGEVVTSWTTTPEFTAGACAPSAGTTVTVDHETAPQPAPCEVPDFIGSPANTAQATWSSAGFATTVTLTKSGNFNIGKQSINANAPVNCSDALIVLEPGGGK